uniref:Uncharacterized protein n=1 Tax=Sphaerodactylus townsendi TaxID=933632 RepID=A0ACB8FU10_9SAUR
MKQKLDEEGNKCSILSKQHSFNERCCMRCCTPFTFLINTKRQCQDCKYNICKNCSSYQKKEKAWLCNVCQQARRSLIDVHTSNFFLMAQSLPLQTPY